MGGYDLFVSDNEPSGWSSPTNLGYPINTSEDQASLFVSANGSRAYYSYEEQKDGVSQKSRLYTFDLPESLRERVKPVSYLKGIVADAKTKKPLAATVELIDLKTNQIISRVQADAQTGAVHGHAAQWRASMPCTLVYRATCSKACHSISPRKPKTTGRRQRACHCPYRWSR